MLLRRAEGYGSGPLKRSRQRHKRHSPSTPLVFKVTSVMYNPPPPPPLSEIPGSAPATELEYEKGIKEEIEEAGDFSERVLEIVVEIESVLSRKDKDCY